ncbi:MAG: GTP cyclohydrolase I FolE2 [Candidatus Omnitrophica bacterium]|nr:GTP cyclohydrolase I FolE2 [Candidatus Omnitrophota bacterium]
MIEPVVLPDVQQSEDLRGIELWKVGVKKFEIPIQLTQKDGDKQTVHAFATMSVGLSKSRKGVHMSRFVLQLSEWSRSRVFELDLRPFLQEAMERLDAQSAHVELDFRYFIEKKAPVTGLSAPMAYGCKFDASITGNGIEEDYRFVLSVAVPIGNLCPCSKEISDYGAHNQRAFIRAQALLDSTPNAPVVWIEDLVSGLEEAASCPVYPFLKRPDEKHVTETQYENPKFVEDVIRDATLVLRDFPGIRGFSLEVEAFESIHDHNAWAAHRENFHG